MEVDNVLIFSFICFSAARRLSFRVLKEFEISCSWVSTAILLSLSEATMAQSWFSSPVDSELLCKWSSSFFSRALTLSWSVLISPRSMTTKAINIPSTRVRIRTATHASNIGIVHLCLHCLFCLFLLPVVGNAEMGTRRINPHHLLLMMQTGGDDVLK